MTSIIIAPMSVEYVDHMGSDLNVVNAARVSFNKVSEEFGDRDKGLINYLVKHDHWSPLAHTSITVRIKAPLFLAAQFKKHQVGLVWNEVSRRYVSSEPEFYRPSAWHSRPDNVKQGSSSEVLEGCYEWWYEQPVKLALDSYNTMLEAGVAPEEARMVLPQCTMTEWMWTGSAMAFARIIKQRKESGAQKAANELAIMIEKVVAPCYPATFDALLNKKD